MRCTSHAHFVMREHRGLSRLSLVTMLGRKIQFTVLQPSERRCQLFCSDTIQIVTMLCCVTLLAACRRTKCYRDGGGAVTAAE